MRWLAGALAVLVLAVVAGCGEADRSGPQKLDLQITNLLPMTGAMDEFGKPGRRATDVAEKEIRKAIAKVGAQHRLAINNLDYESEPNRGVNLATTAAKEGTNCIVGPWGAGQATRVAALVSVPKQVLQISPSASADQFSDVRDLGYLNRVVPRDDLQVSALIELMKRSLGGVRGKKVNIGTLQSVYGKDLTKAFIDSWRQAGGKIGNAVTYRYDQTTVLPQARRLNAGKPDAWVFFDFPEIYLRVVSEMLKDKKSRWSPRKTFAGDSLAFPRLPTFGPAVSEGLRGVAISAPEKGKAAEAFDKLVKEQKGATRQTFDAQQFDAIVLCYLSAVAAGSTDGKLMKDELRDITHAPGTKYTWLELDKAIRALEAGEDIDYEGVSGPIELNRRGDATAAVYDIYHVDKAEVKLEGQIAVPRGSGGV
jgi:ABC-type branched-subunit amino acid transport system substrate-binding protein